MFHFPAFALYCVEYMVFKPCELPHSEIFGLTVATHLPEAYRSYATSFIASLCQGIHHMLLGSIGNPKNHNRNNWSISIDRELCHLTVRSFDEKTSNEIGTTDHDDDSHHKSKLMCCSMITPFAVHSLIILKGVNRSLTCWSCRYSRHYVMIAFSFQITLPFIRNPSFEQKTAFGGYNTKRALYSLNVVCKEGYS